MHSECLNPDLYITGGLANIAFGVDLKNITFRHLKTMPFLHTES
jgi:hypothetical protein